MSAAEANDLALRGFGSVWAPVDGAPPEPRKLGDMDKLRQRDALTRSHLATLELTSCVGFAPRVGASQNAPCPCAILLRENPASAAVEWVLISAPSIDFFSGRHTIGRSDRKICELDRVFAWSRQRNDRIGEILTQMPPQFAYWSTMLGISPEVAPRFYELLAISLNFAMLLTQQLKFHLDVPRPVEMSPLVQPIITTPSYSTFPSGHAVEAYVFALIASKLFSQALESRTDNVKRVLFRFARRVAENRVVAGLHFPIDALPSYVLAEAVSELIFARAAMDPTATVDRHHFEGKRLEVSHEVDPASVYSTDWSAFAGGQKQIASRARLFDCVEKSSVLRFLYGEALKEIRFKCQPNQR
ncbi:MAG: phosphatase PAP2 family protein [Burkholderiales bacterium]|nr:MAG: phosphatase PAP2 family protein [Burkholderiales bacterium]